MTNQELQISHEKLINATPEFRLQYKEEQKNIMFNSVKTIIENGYKHVQFGNGCIKVMKNEFGVYYVLRTGKGTGYDLIKSSDLRFITNDKYECGGNEIVSYK